MDIAEEKPIKLGIKIEKPASVTIHPFFQILAILSLVFIAMTLWLLALEYLAEPVRSWLRSAFDNVSLSI